jgi:hypothetical protein
VCSVQCDLAVSVMYDSSVFNIHRECRRHTSPMILSVTVSDHCIIH